MKVKVEASSYFKKYVGSTNIEVEVAEDINAEGLLELIGIPLGQVGFITVNEQKVNMDAKLRDGQKIGIYPYIIGG